MTRGLANMDPNDKRHRRIPNKLLDYEISQASQSQRNITENSVEKDEQSVNFESGTEEEKNKGSDNCMNQETGDVNGAKPETPHKNVVENVVKQFARMETLFTDFKEEIHVTMNNVCSEISNLSEEMTGFKKAVSDIKDQGEKQKNELYALKKRVQDIEKIMQEKHNAQKQETETVNSVRKVEVPSMDNVPVDNTTSTNESEESELDPADPSAGNPEVILLIDSTGQYITPDKFMGKKTVKITKIGSISNIMKGMPKWQKNETVQYVIIQAGINDLKFVDSIEETKKSLERTMNGLSEIYPNAKIAFSCLILKSNEQERLYQNMVQFNRFLKEFCTGGLKYIDHKKLHHNPRMFKDQIHINSEGTKILVSDMHRLLLPQGQGKTLPRRGPSHSQARMMPVVNQDNNLNSNKIDTLCHMIKAIFTA